MSISTDKLILAFIWAVFNCPLIFASSCNFKMSTVKYFHQSNSKYKIYMNIEEVCAGNAIYKRHLKDISLSIYFRDKKLVSIAFDKGSWLPSKAKFFLKSKKALAADCFAGTRSLTLNLKSNTIRSVNGHYLNLESGKRHKLDCPQLNNN